ncbi:MAG: hypothetical protein EGR89_08920 [[Eubacterium] rectale]|nr:hypothetical protein [Agathobacter rectalis]
MICMCRQGTVRCPCLKYSFREKRLHFFASEVLGLGLTVFYTAHQLAGVEGDFTASAFVRSVTGVDNVCERAALLGAERLLTGKTALNGVTVAVAAEHWEVRFG